MKLWPRLILLFGLLCAGLSSYAQIVEDDTTQHAPFFKATRFDSKFFFECNGTVSQVLKIHTGMNAGVGVSWVVNHKLVICGEYHGLTTPINVQRIVASDEPSYDVINMVKQYAGLGFGYIFFNNKTFSVQPQLTAGWADAQYKIGHANYLRSFGEIEPTVYATYNATKYFRFGIGLNYQAALGCNANGLTDAHLSGIGGMLFLRVGTF